MNSHFGRILGIALFVVVIFLIGNAPLPAAAVVPFTISGRVVDSAGVGIANVNVSAYQGGTGATCCTWVTAVNTDAAGNYDISVAPGTYRIQFYPSSASTFVSRWWSATGTARLFDQATDIALSGNALLPDTALESGFLISGTVTGASGPLADVNVSAYSAGTCCSWVAAAVTSATGTYSFRVPTGSYRLQFYPSQATTYIGKWWDNASGARTFDGGVDIAVTADVTGKDATLTLGRRITGIVTDGTNPIAGANASVFVGGTATCCTWVNGARTDATGAYSVVVPDGTYRLSFSGPSGSNYLSKWWNNGVGADRFEAATDIVLSADQAGLNGALPLGRRISGRITSDGTSGIGGAGVSAYLGGATVSCCTWVGATGADADGNFSLIVPDGTYRFQFYGPAASSYVSTWWDGAAGAGRFQLAADVTVAANATMNATLAAGVRVSGRVTAADGTTGIGRVGVSANLGGTAGCCTWIGGTGTDAQGNYSLVVPTGTYRFYYSAPRDLAYIGQWWNGASGVGSFDSASDVVLTTAVTGQNVRLASGVRISGRVTSDGIAGIAGAGVSAYTGGASAVCCTWAAGTGTASDGSYSLVVPAGTYRLYVGPPRGQGYLGQWWNGAARFDLATDVDATADVSGRDATLTAGVAITGTVTNGTTGIPQVGVSAFVGGAGATCCTWVSGTGTGPDGSYTLVVPANATYRIQFNGPRGSGPAYIGKWWDGTAAGGSARFDQAFNVPVGALGSAAVSGVNTTLATGRRITGRVTSDGIAGIAGVGVSAFTGGSGATCCTWISGTGTDGLGNYTLTVPDGTYRLQFYPPRGSQYLSRWWTNAGGAATFNAAADIPVAADVSGKDAQLTSGLRISGRITSNGTGLANVSVSAFTGGSSATCCTWVSGTNTDALGSYTLVVPPGGTYRLQVWPQRGSSYLGQWWTAAGGVSRFDLASDLTVTSDMTGRDLALQSGIRISGRITSNGTAGIANANVQAFVGGSGATCCVGITGTGTDIDGNYSLTVPAGASYKLRVYAPNGSTYLSQWWNGSAGATAFSGATDVVVTSLDITGRDATLATGISVSGTVTDTSTSPVALQGVWVSANVCTNGYCSNVSGASTDASGAYQIAVPANATYQISFNAPYGSAYVGQWYRYATGPNSATPVVVATTPVTLLDTALATGTPISGTVTSNGTAGIANGNVNAYICGSTGGCQWVAGSNTAANGTYRLIVPAGTYKLQFNPPYGTSYLGQWYTNASDPSTATDVVVVSGTPRTGIDATLGTGFAITGMVRNASAVAIANANVSAQVCGTTSGCRWVSGANSASDGTYRMIVPAGTYKIYFNAPNGSSYVGQWYGNVSGPSASTSVTVSTADVPGIDATLASGSVISGTVTNASASGIGNVNVSAFTGCDSNGNGCQWVGGTNTSSSGTYRLIVPAGTYKIQFYPSQSSAYLSQWYSGAANGGVATAVSVGATDATGIDATLVSGFTISGTVRNSSTVGLANANVSVQTCNSTGGCQGVTGTRTASDGTYRVVVANGTYKVSFNPPNGSSYLGQWYSNASGPTGATDVVVSGSDRTGVDATLATGIAITGTVTDSGAAGVLNANVSAWVGCDVNGNNCQFVAGINTLSDGTFRLLVAPGTYRIQFNGPQGSSYLTQWYNAVSTQTSATPVVVGSVDVPGISATLATGFVISGTVGNGTAGLANANVGAQICGTNGCQGAGGTRTASDGTYRLVVPAGSYKLYFNAPYGSTYLGQWYGNATGPSASPAVTVGPDVSGVNATLATGFVISGMVTNGTTGLANANVSAQTCGTNGCQGAGGSNTGSDGSYRLVVPAGTYKLYFNGPSGSTYVGQWYGNATGPSASPSVTVGPDVSGINATLVTGFAISGTVTNGTTGLANANVSAQVCTTSGCQGAGGTRTATDGSYRLVVPAGSYRIYFNGPSGSNYLSQWYGNATSSSASPAVTVGPDTAGINASLATGYAVSGLVTSNGTAGIGGANVSAFTGCSTTSGCQWAGDTNTAADGTYRLLVPTGTYRIQFSASLRTTQWYNGVPGPATATDVIVTTTSVWDAINATMP